MQTEAILLFLAFVAAGLLLGLRGIRRRRRGDILLGGALVAMGGLAAVLLLAMDSTPSPPLAELPSETSTPTAIRISPVTRPSGTPTPPTTLPTPGRVATPTREASRLHLPLLARVRESLVVQARPTATATPPPPPSATPVPPPPTPTPWKPVEKVTKMGMGIYGSGGNYLLPLMRSQPTVIFLMEPKEDFAREVRRWFPKAFIVGRRVDYDQPLDNPQQRGEDFADYVAALAVPLRGVVDAWMSYNEAINSGNYDRYRAYNTFQVAFARKLQDQYGIPAVAANDGIGVVQPDDYPKYFAEAIRESRYFGVHAYAPQHAKTMRQEAEWYALRYRRIHQALEAAGVPHGPMVITESGLWEGWRGIVSEAEMAGDYIWFTDELEKDAYVVGHAIFGLFGNGQWETFDLYDAGSILDTLGDYWPATR